MKKILYLMIGATLLFSASCQKIDNWDAPGSRIYGNVIDSYTGENLVMDQNDWQIRIWDKTWEEMNPGTVAQYQSLAVMRDGVYNNNKMFSGTYNMLPYDGPFWPTDTIKGVIVGKETQQDFTVTPYLQVLDAAATLGGTSVAPTLTFTCNVKAPIVTGLPNLYEVRPFISLTTFCGNSNNINIGDYNTAQASNSTTPSAKRTVNRSWAAELTARSLPANSDKIPYTMGPLPVKPGYTYYVRIGAATTALSRRYNYSPIIKIEVPAVE
ncbi:MAG TPA: DUF3823 domain-containing protein [Bacteroidales bacterium]|nr:DUF3823 domain-containing protein [Bacteroidales bacterium]